MLSRLLLLCEFCFFAGDRDNDRLKSFAGIQDAQYLYPVFVFRAQPIEPFLEDWVSGLYSLVEFHPVSEKRSNPPGVKVVSSLTGMFVKFPCPCGVPRGIKIYEPAGISYNLSASCMVSTPSTT